MDYSNIFRLSGHSKFVEESAFSSDGSRLVSCSGDQSVLLWDVNTAQKLQTIGQHDAEVWSCDFSKYGIYICSASSDKTVRIWDQRAQGHIATFSGHSKTVWSCAFDPSCSSWKLTSASSDMTVKIWNWKTMSDEHTFCNHGNIVEHVTFSDSGQSLVSCGRDESVQIIEDYTDDSRRKLKVLFGHEGRVNFCGFAGSDDELVLSCSDDRTVMVWDRVSEDIRGTFAGHLNTVWCCDSRPVHDTSVLVSCSSDKCLRFWNMANGTELKRMRKLDDEIESEDQLLCCRFSPDKSLLAVCSNNGSIYLIQMRSILQQIGWRLVSRSNS